MLDPLTILNTIAHAERLLKVIKVFKRDNKPLISAKHLVVKSSSVATSLLSGRFEELYRQLRSKRIYLVSNEVSNFFQKVHRPHIRIQEFNTWEETPVASLRDRAACQFDKTITAEELPKLAFAYDPMITGQIVQTTKAGSLDPGRFVRVTYFEDGCEYTDVAEIIEVRPAWLVLLWLENLSGGPIRIGSYSGSMYFPNDPVGYRSFSEIEGEDYSASVSFPVLQQDESILIPEYSVLAPIDHERLFQGSRMIYEDDLPDMSLRYCYEGSGLGDNTHLIGPSLTIGQVEIEDKSYEVHRFDIENLLTVSPSLAVGSCPVLIGYREGRFRYLKNALVRNPDETNIQGYQFAVIAEIEDEETLLAEVRLVREHQEDVILKNRLLRKGESIVIPLGGDSVSLILSGTYRATREVVTGDLARVFKFEGIRALLADLERTGPGPLRNSGKNRSLESAQRVWDLRG